MNSFAAWLTPRRLRAQAFVLAICLWGVVAVDFATPGPFDRAGNIKFQDFLPVYTAARMISQGRASQIYDEPVMRDEMQSIVGQPLHVRLPYLYGPQVALLFVPLARLPFGLAAGIWAAAGLVIYFSCLFALWNSAVPIFASSAQNGLFREPPFALFALTAVSYPPLFHCFVRGQNSALAMALFTLAYFAFIQRHDSIAGMALGCLMFKPQFLVAIPFVLLLSCAWKALAGLLVSAAAQGTFAWIYFGKSVMSAYSDMLQHTTRWLRTVELSLAAIQMHSLRAFWSLLVPGPQAAFAIYVLSSIAVVVLAGMIWKSYAPLALRLCALTLAAVLASPHLFVYDLLVLAPVFLLLALWIFANHDKRYANAVIVLSYLAFVLPIFGPLSRWTHVQLSVPVFATLLWTLWHISQDATAGHKLASGESRVV